MDLGLSQPVRAIADNMAYVAALRDANELCHEHDHVVTASLVENRVDETGKRVRLLYQANRGVDQTGAETMIPGHAGTS